MSDKSSSVFSVVTSVGVGLWGLSVNEWVAIGGFACALITVLVNWYYRHLHYKLDRDRKSKK